MQVSPLWEYMGSDGLSEKRQLQKVTHTRVVRGRIQDLRREQTVCNSMTGRNRAALGRAEAEEDLPGSF